MKISGYYFLVADIETSTYYKENGEPTAVWLSYGYCNLYNRDGECLERFMYRDWQSLHKFLNKIQLRFMNHKLLCFVHNLSYEFDFFMKNLSPPSKFLTNSSHGVITSALEAYPNIEFRCTYKLSMESLRKIGEQVGLPKLEDPYSMILPEDDIPKERLQYCCRDCDIVAKYVVDVLLKEFGTFFNIPLTKTGRVRKTFNKFYKQECDILGHEPKWDKMPPEDCYYAMNRAFTGGITTSNPLFTGRIIYNVHSYDIASSYPFVMLSEDYPTSIEREYNPTEEMLKEKFWIAKIRFNNIHTKFSWGWLSCSKMEKADELTTEYFNGKLLHSMYVERYITSVDFESIKMTYNWDNIEVLEFYHMYQYGEIPYPYWKSVEIYGIRKGELKQVVKNTPHTDPNFLEINIEYMLSKNDFNSLYGMSVQKLVQQEYWIDELFAWHKKDMKYIYKEKHMKRNFLIGVFITAYARRNLLKAIVTNCPHSFVYCDTDSIKFIGEDNFIDTNGTVPEKYKDNKYLNKLGRFEKEESDVREQPTYASFVTYGAKKYAYTLRNDRTVYLTVAGLPKYKTVDGNGNNVYIKVETEHGEDVLESIEKFVPGIVFKNCKLGKRYITQTKMFDSEDGFEVENVQDIDDETLSFIKEHNIETGGGVALYPTDYSLDITRSDRRTIIKTQRSLQEWLKSKHGIHLTESVGIPLVTE